MSMFFLSAPQAPLSGGRRQRVFCRDPPSSFWRHNKERSRKRGCEQGEGAARDSRSFRKGGRYFPEAQEEVLTDSGGPEEGGREKKPPGHRASLYLLKLFQRRADPLRLPPTATPLCCIPAAGTPRVWIEGWYPGAPDSLCSKKWCLCPALVQEGRVPPPPAPPDAPNLARHRALPGQAKMATVPVYCLCRLPYDVTRFMIECDMCQDWFHGR